MELLQLLFFSPVLYYLNVEFQSTSSSFFFLCKIDTTFVGFRNVCSSETNFMFFTNPINEDLQHPVQVSRVTMVDSTQAAKVFIHRPDVR